MPQSTQRLFKLWSRTKLNNTFDIEIAKDAMVTIAAILVGEQSKEEKHVPQADIAVAEMRLRRTGLPKVASARFKHGIVVTKGASGVSTIGGPFHNFTQTEVVVGCFRSIFGGNGNARGATVNDRRWRAACGTVKTLSTEYDFHLSGMQ